MNFIIFLRRHILLWNLIHRLVWQVPPVALLTERTHPGCKAATGAHFFNQKSSAVVSNRRLQDYSTAYRFLKNGNRGRNVPPSSSAECTPYRDTVAVWDETDSWHSLNCCAELHIGFRFMLLFPGRFGKRASSAA